MRGFPTYAKIWRVRNTPQILLSLSIFMFLLAPAANGLEAVRCSFDPACTCIEWSWGSGSEIEIRCPGEGVDSGWARREPGNGTPDIIDPDGTFRGPGVLSGDTPQAGEVPGPTMTKIRLARNKAITALRTHPECRALFENSPLPLKGETILNMISWRDGDAVQQYNRCDEPDGVPPAYYRNGGRHVMQIYICKEALDEYNHQAIPTLLIHEALHISGQIEDDTRPAGPNDPPNSFAISAIVSDACNLPLQ